MELKFRVIQSNDRGLITQQGDRTYARRGPAKGEEVLGSTAMPDQHQLHYF